MDLTPVDVRKKKEDFGRSVRGYDPSEVDAFLELVAERLEELTRENRSLRDRFSGLQEEVERYREREEALNEALVSAQELRSETRSQAEREADLRVREAESRAEEIRQEARREAEDVERRLEELRSRRAHFLRSFRSLLEGYLAEVEREQAGLQPEATGGAAPGGEAGSAREAGGEPAPADAKTGGEA